MNYLEAKKNFEKYVSNFNTQNGSINLKIIHTYEVVKQSEYIAKNLNLSEEDIYLAKLIALLHDIGRFEQLKKYNSFDDKNIDHAIIGVDILFKKQLIRNFITEDIYDNIIYKAILNHNRLQIEDGLTEKELLHAKIIRDADKLDNFRVKEKDKFEDMFPQIYNNVNVDQETISPKIFNDFMNHKCIKVEDRKTFLDHWLCIIAFIFDLNFPISLMYVFNNDYINKLLDRIKYYNLETQKQIEQIRNCANNYIKESIKKTK